VSNDHALVEAAQALGLLTEVGEVNAGFFQHPIQTLSKMLRVRWRRERLLSAIDGLLERDTAASPDSTTKRYYELLPSDLQGQLWFVAELRADVEVTLGVEGHYALGSGVAARLRAPLVNVQGDAEDPRVVCGSPEGPVQASLTLRLGSATVELDIDAWVEAGAPKGAFGIHLHGLQRDGQVLPDLHFRSDALARGLVDGIVQLLRLALSASGATSDPIVRALAEHLPGLLGLTSDVGVALPLSELIGDAQALRRWLGQLAASDPAVLQAWFGHLVGLVAVDTDVSLTAAPTRLEPWRVPLGRAEPQLGIEFWLEPHADGFTSAVFALRVHFRRPAEADVALTLSAEMLRLPLGGAAPVVVLGEGALLVHAPAEGPALFHSAEAKLGSVYGGVRWNHAGPRPVLELRDLVLPGTTHVIESLDLSNAEVLAETMRQAVVDYLTSKLDVPGHLGAALLTLTGLDGGTPGLDLALLASAPTRAIAEHHRGCLIAKAWAGRQLKAAGVLLGADPTAPVEGSGSLDDPWRIRVFGSDSALLELRAVSSVADTTARLSLALGFVATGSLPETGPAEFDISLAIGLATFDLSPSHPTAITLLPELTGSLTLHGLDPVLPAELPLRCDGWSVDARWQPGMPFELTQRVRGLAVKLPDDPSPLRLGGLRLPPQIDLEAPDLGAGLDLQALRLLLSQLASAALEAAQLDSRVQATVMTLVDALLARFPGKGLAAALQDVPGLLTRWFGQPFDAAGPLAALIPDLSAWTVGLFASSDGQGTPDEPWFRPLGANTRLTAWLAPNGPDRAARTSQSVDGDSPWGSLLRSWPKEALLDVRDHSVLADRLAGLSEHLELSDGLIGIDPERPPDVLVDAAHQDVVGHPDAVRAIVRQVATFRLSDPLCPVIVVVPGLLGDEGLAPLRAALVAGDEQRVDLNRVPGAPDPLDLSRYRSAPFHGIVCDDARIHQLAIVLDKLRALHDGHKPVLIGVSLSAPFVSQCYYETPHLYAGLIVVASPSEGERLSLDDAALVDAFRIAGGLELCGGPHARAVELVTQWISGFRSEADGQQRAIATPVGLLAYAPDYQAPEIPSLRIAGVCGPGLFVTGHRSEVSPQASPATTALVFGVASDILPAALGPLRVRSEARLELGVVGHLEPPGAPQLVFQLGVAREDNWLIGPYSRACDVQVGSLAVFARFSLRDGATALSFELRDVMVRGQYFPRVRADDSMFASSFERVVATLGSIPEAEVLLSWLADEVNIVRRERPGAAWELHQIALDVLLANPAAWLRERALLRLDHAWQSDTPVSVLFGIEADRSAPAGRRRWRWRSSDRRVQITLDEQPWKLTSEWLGESVSVGGQVAVAGKREDVLGSSTSYDLSVELGALRLQRERDGSISLSDPLIERTLFLYRPSEVVDAREWLAQLAGPMGAAFAASVLVRLGEPVGLDSSHWRSLAHLLRDPAAALHGNLRHRPELLSSLANAVADWLGLQARGSAWTLVPGILAIDVTPQAGMPALALSLPEAFRPAANVALEARVALRVDMEAERRNVLVSFAAEVRVNLGASPDAWSDLGLRFTFDGRTPTIALSVAGGAWIELAPHFAGLGALTGAALDRLLPRVLDLAVANTPASEIKAQLLAMAQALELYGTSFLDGATAIGQLDAAHLAAHSSQLLSPLLALLRAVILPSLPEIRFDTRPNDTVAVQLETFFDGALTLALQGSPLAASTRFAGVRLGPLSMDLALLASSVDPKLAANLSLAVDLRDAIGLVSLPTLCLRFESGAALPTITFQPLGAENAHQLVLQFLPTPSVTCTGEGTRLVIEQLAVIPALHLVTRTLGDSLERALWAGGPSLREVFVAATLMDGTTGRIAAQLPQPLDLIAGVINLVAQRLDVRLAPTLGLRFGDSSALGPQLRGHLPFTTDVGEVRLLLGDELDADQPRALALDVLRLEQAHWRLKPRLRVQRTGLALVSATGKDLINSNFVRVGGVAAHLGFVVDMDLSGAAPSFKVRDWRAGARLLRVSIPALSGGGGDSNPIASNLLSSTRADSPKPQFDLEVEWDGQLQLRIIGAKVGEPVWIRIDRAFGPLYIARVGIESAREAFGAEQLDYVGVLVDGAVSLAGLSISVQGLTLKIPPKYPKAPERWKFDLDGLAVSYQKSSISIAGALLKEGSGATTQYLGMLQVIVYGTGVTALGGYSQLSNGEPSLFAFVVINANIGGPPYLFITGVAGGFGFNRRLIPPSKPEQVPRFPLMAALAGQASGDPNTKQGASALLQSMSQSIVPARGEMWLAAGVKFTTFALLETNALAYVQVGNGLEIGLLGLMKARLPSAEFSIASIELALMAKYSSVDNILIVRAELTPNSWLFTKDCRPTGGFAFVVWFGKPQALLTLGGYHSDFPPPPDYPVVPRLGFRWTPSPDAVVKGAAYFAITPEAAMLGGRLEARVEVGVGYGELVVNLDALLWFDPPRFVFDFGLRVKGQAFGFPFELGCSVKLQLPPLHVFVHVNFLWGFDLEFGTKRAPRYLSYAEFSSKFLGDPGRVCGLALRAGPASTDAGAGSKDAPVDPTSVGLTIDNPLRVLHEFVIATTTKLPATTARYGSAPVSHGVAEVSEFYLVPMGPGGGVLRPQHRVAVTRLSDQTSVGAALTAAVETTGTPSAIYWNPARGTLPTQEEMNVRYSDMEQSISGVSLRATSTPVASAGLSDVAIADIVDELPALPITWAPKIETRLTRSFARTSAVVSARPARREPELRWARSRGPRRARGGSPSSVAQRALRTQAAPQEVAGLSLWAVRGSTHRIVADAALRVRQLDSVGRVIGYGHDLQALTSAVALDIAPQALRYSGWQLHTRAHPVAPSAFVTATCGVAFAAPVHVPSNLSPAEGIAMFALSASAGTVVTDLAPDVATIMIQCDAMVADHDLTSSVVIQAEHATLELVQTIAALSTDGRVHCVYRVTDVQPQAARVSIAVAVRPLADGRLPWTISGVIASTQARAADDLIAAVQADRRVVLIADEDELPPTAAPMAVRFSARGGSDG
jgi:large repetitive protein